MERVLGASANSTRAAAIRIRTILFVKGNPAQNQTTSEPVNALIRAGMKVGAFGRKIKRPFPISKPVCAWRSRGKVSLAMRFSREEPAKRRPQFAICKRASAAFVGRWMAARIGKRRLDVCQWRVLDQPGCALCPFAGQPPTFLSVPSA